MSGTFDLLSVMCKQHHGAELNPILNGPKNGDVDSMCKRDLTIAVDISDDGRRFVVAWTDKHVQIP